MNRTSEQAGSIVPWNTLDRWSARAFFVGGGMFGIAAVLSAYAMVTGEVRVHQYLGEAFIAFGWIGGLVGLLGLYRGVAERSRWLARAGGAFTVVGLMAFTVLGVVSLVVFVTGGSIASMVHPALLLLGVILGSLLAFVTFSAATFRSDAHPRVASLLLLVPAAIFVVNFVVLPVLLGGQGNPPAVGLVVVGALALGMLAIGYVLRTDRSLDERHDAVASHDLRTD